MTGCVAVGEGLTVIVKVLEVPGQVNPPFKYCAVTVMVATTGVAPLLTAVKEAMSPVPLAANPMDVVLLVQVYPVPLPVKFTALVGNPLHTIWSTGCVTVGAGLTIML